MKIGVVDVAADKGGALSVLTEFIEYINNYDQENDWHIFTSTAVYKNMERVHIHSNPTIKKSWLHRWIWDNFVFKKIANRYKFDLVISLQNVAINTGKIKQFVYFHNALLVQKRNYYSLFNSEERKLAIYTRFVGPYTRHTLKKATQVIVQTKTMKKNLEKFLPKKRIVYIYPNVSIENNKSKKFNPANMKGFIYPAAPDVYRNHEMIIQAVRHLKENKIINFEVLFTFIGNENKYAKRIYEACKDISEIKFVGYLSREELLNYYCQYVVVSTSKIESFPMIFTEAQYFGTPIIAKEVDYAREILYNYESAFFVSDFKSLANTMEKVLLNKNKGFSVNNVKKNNNYKDGWKKLLDLISKYH